MCDRTDTLIAAALFVLALLAIIVLVFP